MTSEMSHLTEAPGRATYLLARSFYPGLRIDSIENGGYTEQGEPVLERDFRPGAALRGCLQRAIPSLLRRIPGAGLLLRLGDVDSTRSGFAGSLEVDYTTDGAVDEFPLHYVLLRDTAELGQSSSYISPEPGLTLMSITYAPI